MRCELLPDHAQQHTTRQQHQRWGGETRRRERATLERRDQVVCDTHHHDTDKADDLHVAVNLRVGDAAGRADPKRGLHGQHDRQREAAEDRKRQRGEHERDVELTRHLGSVGCWSALHLPRCLVLVEPHVCATRACSLWGGNYGAHRVVTMVRIGPHKAGPLPTGAWPSPIGGGTGRPHAAGGSFHNTACGWPE